MKKEEKTAFSQALQELIEEINPGEEGLNDREREAISSLHYITRSIVRSFDVV